jgi:putative DNA primase/helicase
MLTQEMVNIRLLGHSRNIEVPMTSTVFATGNNLIVTDDLMRRTLLCRLDAGVERPELRTFKSNVLKVARAERVGLVIDVLTILRAWHLSGEPESDNPLGSFEEWSFRVRQPLLWLDQVDPCSSIGLVRENDPARTALDIVLQQWTTTLGTTNALTVQEIISRAVVVPDLYNALMTVAAAA